ncbi:MAG: glutamate racemase [Bacteroidales bacterium]|nr:glutamate racemase [Bacteroidales bacterium]
MAVIGIMDSGVGGLSVFREIRRLMPGHHYLYYSDNAHCPYGDKSPEYIRKRLHEITGFFLGKEADAMVLACNTATAAAIEDLRACYDIPFVGMEPAVKPAALGTMSGVIGVLATAGTLKGSKYLNTKGRFSDRIRIEEKVGRGFVELVEAGKLTGPEAEATVEASLKPLLETGADRIVLGCTHYPFLLETLQKVATRLGYPDVQFIDPAPAVAARLQSVLSERGLAPASDEASADAAVATEFFASGSPATLLSFAGKI